MLPNFLIIGAARAATTWLSKNITFHDDIFIPDQKELHFFDRDYQKGIDYYKDYFRSVSNEKAVGEATPAYLHTESVPARISKELGPVKLIVSLRDPVDRLYSRFLHAKARYRANANITFKEKINSKKAFIYEGFYFDHLERYLQYFPIENMLVIFFDDIHRSPDKVLQRLYSFIGVDENFISPISNQKINSALSKGRLGKSRGIYLMYKIMDNLKLYSIAKRLEEMNRSKKEPLPAEDRQWLIESYYLPQIKKLEKLLGVDLPNWKK